MESNFTKEKLAKRATCGERVFPSGECLPAVIVHRSEMVGFSWCIIGMYEGCIR